MAASHFQEATHHCAIFHCDDQLATDRSFKTCKLHPGHKEFMTVDEFEKKTPSKIHPVMPIVRNYIDRTVRVVANHISADRPDTHMYSKITYPCIEKRGSYNWIRYGSGFLVEHVHLDVKELCPCPECKTPTCQSPNRESYYFVIKTATHVIFDKQEAQNARFEFFYDSEDRSNVKNIYGVTVLGPDLLRLETDRCFVMCVTHDDSLAEKLDRLFVDNNQSTDGVLVSHPHGVSKRISIGDDPQCTLLMIPNKTSVKIYKGTEIRFPGCHDTASLVKDINHVLEKPVIGFDDASLVLHCDLNIYRPEGIVVETDNYDFWQLRKFETEIKVWWKIISPGTQLVTEDGKRCTFPYIDDKLPGVSIEVFGKRKYFLDEPDIDNCSTFAYSRHNMASCPGSSGAHVESFVEYMLDSNTGNVHFGDSGDYNISSLFRIHAPDDDDDQESETNSMKKWTDSVDKIQKKMFYEIIT